MASVRQEVHFDASPERLFEAYMDAEQHAAFTGGAAEIGRGGGDAFSCHGGQIVGRLLEIEPHARIVQAWRAAAWPEGTYSVVRLSLRPEDGGTTITLDHDAVPDEAREHIDAGWHQMYWEPLRAYLAG